MKYVYPVIWLNRSEHCVESCYFCQTQPRTVGITYKWRQKIVYHSCTSVKTAILRSILNPKVQSEESEITPHNLSMESICNSKIIESFTAAFNKAVRLWRLSPRY